VAEVRLREVEWGDIEYIRCMRNHPSVMPYCRQYKPLSMEDMEKWYERLNNDKDYNLTNDLFVIISDNIIVGVCGLTRIDWRNRKGEVTFYVVDTEDRAEIISKALSMLMGYAFETLNLHKIYWPVYSFNPLLEVYEGHMGREYVAKKEYYWEGAYHDRVVLVAYNEKLIQG